MKRLLRFFNIYSGEEGKAGLLLALMFVSYFYATSQDIITYSLFVAREGTEYLPYMYVLLSVLLILFPFFIARFFLKRVNLALFSAVMILIIILHLLNFGIMRWFPGSTALNFFMISSSGTGFTVMWYLISLVVQDVLDIESSKRIVPFVTAGGIAGAVTATVCISFGSGYLTLDTVFLASWIPLILSLVFSLRLLTRYRNAAAGENFETNSVIDVGRYIFRNPFYLMMIIFGTILMSSYWLNDYLINGILREVLVDENRISGFISQSEMIFNIINMLLNVLILSWMIRRLGSLRTMYLVLVLIGAGAGLVFNRYSLAMVMGSRIIFNIFAIEIVSVLYQLLYQPVQNRLKPAVILFLQFFIRSGGLFFAGLISLAGSLDLVGFDLMARVCLGLIAVAFIIWMLFNRLFLRTLKNTLETGENVDIDGILGGDLNFDLLQNLASDILDRPGSQGEVILELLKNVNPDMRDRIIWNTLEKSDVAYRLKLIDYICQGEFSEELLFDLQKDRETRVREYLIYRSFIHYSELKKRLSVPEVQENWLRYLEGFQTEVYVGIKNPLLNTMRKFLESGSEPVYRAALLRLFSIMDDSSAIEVIEVINRNPQMKKTNARFLSRVYQHYQMNTEILGLVAKMPLFSKASSLYDVFFRNYYQYKIVREVRFPVKKALLMYRKNRTYLSRLYLLHLVSCSKKSDLNRFLPVAEKLLAASVRISDEYRKALKLPESRLLTDELKEIMMSSVTVLLNFYFRLYKLPEIKNKYEMLNDDNERLVLIELIQNSFSPDIYEKLNVIIGKGKSLDPEKPDYGRIDIGLSHPYLTRIYHYLGGVVMGEETRNRIEKLFVLKSIPMFEQLDLINLIRISDISRYETIEKDEILVKEGDESDKFYVIITGNVEVTKNGKKIDRVGPGGIIGEQGIIDRDRRTATVTAEEQVLLLVIDGHDLTSLLKSNAAISYSVIQTLSGRLRALLDRQ